MSNGTAIQEIRQSIQRGYAELMRNNVEIDVIQNIINAGTNPKKSNDFDVDKCTTELFAKKNTLIPATGPTSIKKKEVLLPIEQTMSVTDFRAKTQTPTDEDVETSSGEDKVFVELDVDSDSSEEGEELPKKEITKEERKKQKKEEKKERKREKKLKKKEKRRKEKLERKEKRHQKEKKRIEASEEEESEESDAITSDDAIEETSNIQEDDVESDDAIEPDVIEEIESDDALQPIQQEEVKVPKQSLKKKRQRSRSTSPVQTLTKTKARASTNKHVSTNEDSAGDNTTEKVVGKGYSAFGLIKEISDISDRIPEGDLEKYFSLSRISDDLHKQDVLAACLNVMQRARFKTDYKRYLAENVRKYIDNGKVSKFCTNLKFKTDVKKIPELTMATLVYNIISIASKELIEVENHGSEKISYLPRRVQHYKKEIIPKSSIPNQKEEKQMPSAKKQKKVEPELNEIEKQRQIVELENDYRLYCIYTAMNAIFEDYEGKMKLKMGNVSDKEKLVISKELLTVKVIREEQESIIGIWSEQMNKAIFTDDATAKFKEFANQLGNQITGITINKSNVEMPCKFSGKTIAMSQQYDVIIDVKNSTPITIHVNEYWKNVCHVFYSAILQDVYISSTCSQLIRKSYQGKPTDFCSIAAFLKQCEEMDSLFSNIRNIYKWIFYWLTPERVECLKREIEIRPAWFY